MTAIAPVASADVVHFSEIDDADVMILEVKWMMCEYKSKIGGPN
jgi:hypothetical protein